MAFLPRVTPVLVLLLCLATPARSAIIAAFSVDPDPVVAGEPTQLRLTLTAQADPGFFNARLGGGTVSLLSGDGRQESFAITPNQASQTFETSFVYGIAQSLAVSFVATATLVQDYWQQFIAGYRETGYWRSYRCGLFSRCEEWVRTGAVPVFSTRLATSNHASSLTGTEALTVAAGGTVPHDPAAEPTAVPEPAALAILGAGLLGLVAARRRQRLA